MDAYIASLEQAEEIKGRPLNENRVVPRHIPQNRLEGLHHSPAQKLDSAVVAQRQHGAKLEDVNQRRVIDSAALPRLLSVGLGRGEIVRLDCNHG